MELHSASQPRFCQWVTDNDFLGSPLILVDVGCLGGHKPSFNIFGGKLVVHGFDANPEAIQELQQANPDPSRFFYNSFALGDAEGTARFFVRSNRYESSFYGNLEDGDLELNVPIVTLDEHFSRIGVDEIDFLKIDVEGHEKHVLAGGSKILERGPVLALEVESNFNSSPVYPGSHFGEISEIALKLGMTLLDLAYYRHPRPIVSQSLDARVPGSKYFYRGGRPSILNILFVRAPFPTGTGCGSEGTWEQGEIGIERVLKLAMIYELFGFPDWTLDIITSYSDLLSSRMDVELGRDLLMTYIAELVLQAERAREYVEFVHKHVQSDLDPAVVAFQLSSLLDHQDAYGYTVIANMAAELHNLRRIGS